MNLAFITFSVHVPFKISYWNSSWRKRIVGYCNIENAFVSSYINIVIQILTIWLKLFYDYHNWCFNWESAKLSKEVVKGTKCQNKHWWIWNIQSIGDWRYMYEVAMVWNSQLDCDQSWTHQLTHALRWVLRAWLFLLVLKGGWLIKIKNWLVYPFDSDYIDCRILLFILLQIKKFERSKAVFICLYNHCQNSDNKSVSL